MPKPVTVSAPGKAHLIGEHAVVGGEPAIIGAVGKRLYLSVSPSPLVRYRDERFDSDGAWSLNDVQATTREAYKLWDECSRKQPKPDYTALGSRLKENGFEVYLQAAIGTALEKFGDGAGAQITVLNQGGLPPGSGLGSSAALAVCLVKGVAAAYGKDPTAEEINETAFSIEKLMHGTPSGGDNTTATYGGLVWFRKAMPKNEIRSLREEIPHALENLRWYIQASQKKQHWKWSN